MPKKEKFVAPWKKWAASWKEIKHPSRPCRKNIEDYKRFLEEVIRGKKCPKALVFGATPEIRDLLARYPKIEVTIVDMNLEMIMAMTELMRYKAAAEKEIWICHNWLNVPLPEKSFDVLLGDYIVDNLPRGKHPAFFQKAHHLLKDDGYFLVRFYAEYPESKEYDFQKLLKEYLHKGYSARNFENFWVSATFSSLRQGYVIGTDLFFQELKKYIGNPRVKKVYQKARKILPPHKVWTYFNWEKDKWMLEKYFIVKNKAPEPRYSAAYNWGYVMQLKKK